MKSQFEKIFYSILVVTLSECNDNGTQSACKQEFLLQTIRNFKIDETENQDERKYNSNDSLDEIDVALKDMNLPHFEELRSGAKSVAEEARTGQQPSAYYCPNIVTPLVRFAKYYILWTNVMLKINKSKYTVASSARSEIYFNEIKNITFSDV